MILHLALFSALVCLASSVQGEDAVPEIVGLVPPQPDSSAQDYWTGKRNLVPQGRLLNILLKGSPEGERVERDVNSQHNHSVDHNHADHQHDHQHDHTHDHTGDAKKREKRGYCSRCGGQVGYGGYGGGGYGGYGGGCGNNCGGGRPIYQQPIYQRPNYGGGGICSVCGQPYGGGGYGGGGGGSYSSSQSSSSSSSGSYGK